MLDDRARVYAELGVPPLSEEEKELAAQRRREQLQPKQEEPESRTYKLDARPLTLVERFRGLV